LTGLCARKNETWVFSGSGGNGIGKKAKRKFQTPTEKEINRTSNQQKKKSRRLGQVLDEGEREHRGKLRVPQKKQSTEKAIKATWAEAVAAARVAPRQSLLRVRGRVATSLSCACAHFCLWTCNCTRAFKICACEKKTCERNGKQS